MSQIDSPFLCVLALLWSLSGSEQLLDTDALPASLTLEPRPPAQAALSVQIAPCKDPCTLAPNTPEAFLTRRAESGPSRPLSLSWAGSSDSVCDVIDQEGV